MGYLPGKISKKQQCLISVLLILAVSGICMGIASFLGYRVIAFILLLTVSVIAVLFDIWPVVLSAVLSAFIWNFFFIRRGSLFMSALLKMSFFLSCISSLLN
jgi:K+-sensing histidine kinase KdpD